MPERVTVAATHCPTCGSQLTPVEHVYTCDHCGADIDPQGEDLTLTLFREGADDVQAIHYRFDSWHCAVTWITGNHALLTSPDISFIDLPYLKPNRYLNLLAELKH